MKRDRGAVHGSPCVQLALALAALALPAGAGAQTCILSLLDDPARDRVVSEFADTLFQKRAAMGTNLLSALDNFETTLGFASDYEAEPRIVQTLLETSLQESASYLVGLADKQVPGTSQLVAAIKAVSAEVERAAAARSSHDVGRWIRSQRALISNRMTGAGEETEDDGPLSTSVAIKDAILEDLCWLEQDGGDLDAAVEEIARAQGELGPVPSEQSYRRALFEDWIRASFRSLSGTGRSPGTVHLHWEVEVDGSPSDHGAGPYPLEWDEDGWSAEVVLPSPYGERIAGGLDELGVSPLEARVVRVVCFETDGIAGGTATYCGALAPDGRVRSEPDPPWARQAFESTTWREATTSFRH